MSTDGAGPWTLGASLHDGGARFAVRSRIAEAVELCLLSAGREERVALERRADGVFAIAVHGVGAGQRYGLRVHGPFDPATGRWCDPAKLLLDPRARAFHGTVGAPRAALRAGSGADTASLVPASVVVDDAFAWDGEGDRPRHPWEDTVVYEVHVKGATRRHPGVPEALRGTYLGLAHEAFLDHLVALGVTTVELLPVHELVDEAFLAESGRTNYWGYNPIGVFAPTARYAASRDPGAAVTEFKTMVAALHAAGLEVVLDVVYNHTAEGDEDGPTLSLRGIDGPAYYRRDEHGLVDTTGCGNSIDAGSEDAIELVLDSLRYWAVECHVDGFRFDLAPTLARPRGTFAPDAPFLERCRADPVLAACKLICEPWDLGCEDSYALGRFPAPYREWNGRFRDRVRDFWCGADGGLAALATCLAGSADLFGDRGATASVNYVASHDGFTLRDVCSYERKHNEANGEANEDGTDDNRSWNCGVEGETDDPAIDELRRRLVRALLATVLVSRGVPMVLAGDELWRTQGGNNNAYCQDNEVSWLDWPAADAAMSAFVAGAIALRREVVALRGRGRRGQEATIRWRRRDGDLMTEPDWADGAARCIGLHATAGEEEALVLVNGGESPVDFVLPPGSGYRVGLSSAVPSRAGERGVAGRCEVSGRDVVVLTREP